MITDDPRDERDRLKWNDIELLPLYGAAILVVGFLGHGLANIGGVVEAESVKAGLVVALIAIQPRFGANDGPLG